MKDTETTNRERRVKSMEKSMNMPRLKMVRYSDNDK